MINEENSKNDETDSARFTTYRQEGDIMDARCWMSAVLATLMLAGGCGTKDYSIVIRNVGTGTVSRAHVTYGDFRSVGGVLPPNTFSKHMHPGKAIPAVATVEWQAENGTVHQKRVKVRTLVPKGFRGDIGFEIGNSDSLEMKVTPWREPHL
jgi:hypothetical protein